MGASNNYSCIKLLLCAYSVLGRRQWHPTPVLLPGKSHGRRSLVGYSPRGHEESDKTEQLHFHFSLSCIGEGNGNPLQCSCLENPRDGGAWWAALCNDSVQWGRRVRHDWSDLAAAAQSAVFCDHYWQCKDEKVKPLGSLPCLLGDTLKSQCTRNSVRNSS